MHRTPTKFSSTLDLARLPWFELRDNSRLVVADDSIGPIIDMHTHLAMAFFRRLSVDLDATFVLGHSGALQSNEAIALGQRYENTYFELSSLGLADVRDVLERITPNTATPSSALRTLDEFSTFDNIDVDPLVDDIAVPVETKRPDRRLDRPGAPQRRGDGFRFE